MGVGTGGRYKAISVFKTNLDRNFVFRSFQVTTSENLRNLEEGVDEEDHETVEKVRGRHQMAEEFLQVGQ